MRALGLDIGEKRIGVAVSDPSGRVATPVTVLQASGRTPVEREIARLIVDYEVARIVVGLPLSMDGTEGPQARRVRVVAARIASAVEIPVEFMDERLSSAEAGRRMREVGASERDQRGSKDMVAATIFLQAYLDSGGTQAISPGADR